MCMYDYADPPEFFSEREQVARKSNRCGECFRAIDVGERYQYVSGKWDGVFSQHRICAHCLVAAEWLQTNCGGYVYGDLLEDMREHHQEYGGLGLGRFVALMGRKWMRCGKRVSVPAAPPSIENLFSAYRRRYQLLVEPRLYKAIGVAS